MKKLIEGMELAVRANACKGNIEAFKNALDKGNKIECYQITLGNRLWLIERGIIKDSDIPKLEKLAQGVGKIYYDNGQLCSRAHCKNGKCHGLYELWYSDGELWFRGNYENGEIILENPTKERS